MKSRFTLTHLSPCVVLLLSMLLGGWIAVWLGKELCWDQANYHYYNPYALLHHRQQLDFWPSSFIHQYLNPAIDMLPYYLINHVTPRQTEFVLGALHGINLWLVYLIARYFTSGRFAFPIALILALLGIYGPTALPGMGSFQNDNLVTLFVLGFVWLHLRFIHQHHADNTWRRSLLIMMSGSLLGMGLGLKLTTAIYVIAACVSIALMRDTIKARCKQLVLLNLGIALGFLLTAGYWMWWMWQQHHNPLFPFFNNIFHSQDFTNTHWRDTRSLPQGLLQTLFYPFYFSFDGRIADAPFRDLRFLMVYVLLLLASVSKLLRRPATPLSKSTYWFTAFFLSAYVIWQWYFSIARYLAPLEMLAPLMMYLLVREWLRDAAAQVAVLTLVFYIMAAFMQPIPVVRAHDYGDQFFNVHLPKPVHASPNAMVLIAYTAYVRDSNPRPQTYLIPFFPPQWRFVGVPFWQEQLLEDNVTIEKIRALVAQYPKDIYLLTSDRNMPALLLAAQRFGLQPDGVCDPITSDRQQVSNQGVLLCHVTRSGSPVRVQQAHEETTKH